MDGEKSFSVNRSEYVTVQTPQCFNIELIKKAYQQNFSTTFTDDASVVEKLGHCVSLVEGNIENIKITTPQDLILAENLIG
jgi:2-C-methyl-D-erythritol 4-phosphate cytidylyltransferase